MERWQAIEIESPNTNEEIWAETESGSCQVDDLASARALELDLPEETEDSPPETETAAEIALKNGVYHEIRRKLHERFGLPPHEIAFIHEADTPAKKAALFADVNAGRVRVLLGSTAKLGTGVNVQQRLVALHHVDQPWKPAELEQREGRILRQGNLYPEVFVFHYVTERSFDGYMLQTLEAKARFISQIMAGEVTARTAEDVGDMVLTVAQVKAVASGNPAVQRRIETEVKLVKLDRLRAAFYQQRAVLRADIEELPQRIAAQTALIAGHERALARREPLVEDAWRMTLKRGRADPEEMVWDKRERAGAELRRWAEVLTEHLCRGGGHRFATEEIGSYRGFRLSVAVAGNARFAGLTSLFDFKAEVHLRAEAGGACYAAQVGESNTGVTQSMDYQLRHIEAQLEQARSKLLMLETRLTKAREEVNRPWGPAGEYNRLRREYEALSETLQAEGVALESNTAFVAEEIIEATGPEANPAAVTESTAATATTDTLAADLATPRNPFTGLEDWPLVATETEPVAAESESSVSATAQPGLSLFDAVTDNNSTPEIGPSAKPDLPTVKPAVIPATTGAALPWLAALSQPLPNPRPTSTSPRKKNPSPKPGARTQPDNQEATAQGSFAWGG